VNILENVDLRLHSTMRLGGKARYLADAKTEGEVKELVEWAKHKNLQFIVIGQGSNIVWRDEGFDGLIIVNRISGRQIFNEDSGKTTVRFGAGENWDECVIWTLEKGFSGLEFLSRIPGTVGAAPVQNIGAYGRELSDLLEEIAAYDTQTDEFVTIAREHCGFGYRTSRFKAKDKGRYIILNVTLNLGKENPKPPFYESLQKYLDEHQIKDLTPESIRSAVTEIRKIKLPDPSVVPNNGSFFTNPIIEESKFQELQKKYPEVKGWTQPDGRMKVAAGWLVEQAGFKDFHDKSTGMGTWPHSALVMINEHARSTADLLEFRQKITFKVEEMFDIVLEQEPELLP